MTKRKATSTPALTKPTPVESPRLQPPNLASKVYQVEGGYAKYVSDFRLFLGAVEQIKAEVRSRASIAAVAKATVASGTVTKDKMVTYVVSYQGAPGFSVVRPLSQNPTDFGSQYIFGEEIKISFNPTLLKDGLAMSARGHTYSRANALDYSDVLITRSATKVVSTGTLEVKSVLRKKGPATTAKKVRTPAEAKAKEESDKKRVEKNAWFTEHKLALAKAQAEEKLAASLARRAALVRAADKSVDVTADIENGWRLVTHKKTTTPKRVKTVRKAKGVTTTTLETKRS